MSAAVVIGAIFGYRFLDQYYEEYSENRKNAHRAKMKELYKHQYYR